MAEPPRDRKTEEIREKLRSLNERREQRKALEVLRKIDLAFPPEQREAMLAATKGIPTIVDTPAIRKAMEGIDVDKLVKAVEQLQEAAEAHRARETELVNKAIDWLDDKWKDRECPYCGVADWQVGTPLEISLGLDEAMSPAFPVMCGNCGQTALVNAVVAGLVDQPDEPEAGE